MIHPTAKKKKKTPQIDHLMILKNNKQTQNHLHCHPQPTTTSTVHRPQLTQPKSIEFATKSSQKPTKITHKNNQNSTNPQIQQQKNSRTTNQKKLTPPPQPTTTTHSNGLGQPTTTTNTDHKHNP